MRRFLAQPWGPYYAGQFASSAIWSAFMLAFFAVIMTGGFWLRHGHWIWESV